jgi:hypothetical protein
MHLAVEPLQVHPPQLQLLRRPLVSPPRVKATQPVPKLQVLLQVRTPETYKYQKQHLFYDEHIEATLQNLQNSIDDFGICLTKIIPGSNFTAILFVFDQFLQSHRSSSSHAESPAVHHGSGYNAVLQCSAANLQL